jgi:hypothetical protein
VYVLRNDGSGCDHGALADGNAREDRCAEADPGAIADLHRTALHAGGRGPHVVLEGERRDLASDVDVRADLDAAPAIQQYVRADHGPVPDSDPAGVDNL